MNHLRVLLPGLLALAMLLLSARESSAIHTFDPTTDLTLSSGAANTPAKVTTTFTLLAPDTNFGVIVGFIPPEWGVAEADDFPIGTQLGSLDSVATLGLFNSACNLGMPVSFDLLNGSIDTTATINPNPAATPNRLQPLAPSNPLNGVNRYPSYLNSFFQGVDPSRIQARLVGHAVVASGLDVILNLVIFKPGTQLPLAALIHRFVQDPLAFDPRLGFPTVIVLQDPTAPEGPSSITDFCATLKVDTVIFDDFLTNPGNGDYTWVTFAASQRDPDGADGDGLENGLDTCPFVTNIEDPRVPFPFGDPDLDGIDSACDNLGVTTPDPGLDLIFPGLSSVPWSATSPCRFGAGDDFLAPDCDLDGFPNRQDNCPQQFNSLQEDADFDGIGDACDTLGAGPNTPDGTVIEVCLARSVTIPGSGTSVAVTPPDFQPCGNAPLPPLCNGQFATLFGGPGSDSLTGTSTADVIHGLGGNDTISGMDGDDVICGGDGDDKLKGGRGGDELFGEGGDDELKGGLGGDELFGGDGNDDLKGGPGDDEIFGGDGNDELRGSPGDDEIFGDAGEDTINGGPGPDTCDGGTDTDFDTQVSCLVFTNFP